MKTLLPLFVAILLTLLAACRPTPTAPVREIALPTFVPLPTAAIEIDTAWQAATNFLHAWQIQDFDSMYNNLSFTSREAISREAFEAEYRNAQNIMTMTQLRYQEQAISRIGERTVQLIYDVAFETSILGNFDDQSRTLTLVLDGPTNDWRVAWSRGDIFPEMGSGADLRFESNVPSRANIHDRNGYTLANMNGVIIQVNVIEEEMPEPERCLSDLADVLGETEADLQATLDRAGPNWVVEMGTIERPTYSAEHQRLEASCAATFASRPVRQYLEGSLMPHILGYVGFPTPDQVDEIIRQGFNAETMVGQSGIERSWDAVLRGLPGGRLALYASDGRRLRVLADASSQVPESLWLTIDADLQRYFLQAIGEAYLANASGWGSRSPGAAGVVLDVNTGEVLALASWPTFDGNAQTAFPAIGREIADDILEEIAADERVPQINRPVQGVFPAGSTFKVIDAAAVLDTGLWTPSTRYYSTGSWTYQGDTRYDWFGGGHGSITVVGALTVSCNSCFYEAGFQLNEVNPFLLPGYAERMGLGAVTGLTDLSEASGTIPDPTYIDAVRNIPWSYADAVNLAIGQGEVEVSPLQMARMYAAIANGGTLYRPQLVREQGILDQRTFVAEPEINGEFNFREGVVETIREGLCNVTNTPSGTAEFVFRLPTPSPLLDIGVCGKTGTAETGIPGEGTHAWFIAWGPEPNPEIVVAVMVENGGEGSEVAAPIVERVMEYYFFLMEESRRN